MEKMLTFEEWLKVRDKNLHEGLFDTLKNYGKTAALLGAGAVGMAGYNAYQNNQNIPSSSTTYPAAASFVEPQTPSPSSFVNQKPTNARERFQARIKAHDRKMSQKQKGTEKEINGYSTSTPDAEDFLGR